MGSSKTTKQRQPSNQQNAGVRKKKKDAEAVEDILADSHSPTPQKPKPRLITPSSMSHSMRSLPTTEAAELLLDLHHGGNHVEKQIGVVQLSEEAQREQRLNNWVQSEWTRFQKSAKCFCIYLKLTLTFMRRH